MKKFLARIDKIIKSSQDIQHRIFYEGFTPDITFIQPLKQSLLYFQYCLNYLNETNALISTLPVSAISPDGMLGGRGFILPVNSIREITSRITIDILKVVDSLSDELRNPMYTIEQDEFNKSPDMTSQDKEMSVYNRFGLGDNVENTSEGSFIQSPQNNLDRPKEQGGSIDRDWVYQVRGDPDKKYFIGLDIGYKNSGFAIAIVHYDAPNIVLDYSIVFYAGEKPFEDVDTIPTNEMADFVGDLYSRFNIIAGISDQWEAISFLQMLSQNGISNIIKVNFTPEMKTKMFNNFRDRVGRGEFTMPQDDKLLDELKGLEQHQVSEDEVEVEAEEGHDDLTDAVVRAVWICEKLLKRMQLVKKDDFKEEFGEMPKSDEDGRYQDRDKQMERAKQLVEEFLTKQGKKKIAAKEESEEDNKKEDNILRRKRPTDEFSYNSKIAHGLFTAMVLSTKALLFLYKGIAKISSVPASAVSPDGNLGGEGYVMSFDDMRKILNQSANDLARITDTFADEIRNPAYKLDSDKLFDMASRELEDYYDEGISTSLSGVFQGDSFTKVDDSGDEADPIQEEDYQFKTHKPGEEDEDAEYTEDLTVEKTDKQSSKKIIAIKGMECPVCGEDYEIRNRGFLGESSCKNGHKWFVCPVHGVVIGEPIYPLKTRKDCACNK